MRIPDGLIARRALGDDWSDWLDRLPALVGSLLGEWRLTEDGASRHGYCSLVLPVRDAEGQRAVLKVTFDGDEESVHEGLALRIWGGGGTVRLLRADPHRRALLLERLSVEDLGEEWDEQACAIVAGLYRRLHLPTPPQLAPLPAIVDRWRGELQALGHRLPLPRRYVDQALALARDLVTDPGSQGTLIHGDLHYDNVLAADREPWLVIDPKPMSGDPHYEPAPMLWNRMAELEGPTAVQGVRDGLRRRFHTVVDTAGLEEDRARDWVVVRAVLNAGWTVQDAVRADRALTRQEQAWVTRCLTVTKAVQD